MTIMPWTGPGPNPEQPWDRPQGPLGRKRRGGLFGSMPPMQQPAAVEQPLAQKTKFFGEGGVGRGIAGNIGDFLLQYAGAQPIYQPAMQQRQAMVYDQQQRQQTRTDRLEDWKAQQEYERANPAPTAPFDDNAGNRWTIGADGKPKLLFRDPNAKRIPQKVTGPNGEEFIEYIEIPNLVNEDGTFQTRASSGPQPGAIEDGHRFKGGNPADPSSWEPVGGSSPPGIGSAPQAPTIMTRAQYQGFVQSMGKAEADAFLRRNGLTVGIN